MSDVRSLRWAFLGRVGYEPALRLQEALRDDLRRGMTLDHLLLLEHPHVYTLGRSANRRDIIATDDWLRARGIDVVECDRGGQVTYHGPGQLVGYPVVDLSPDRRDLRRYVADLQEVLVRTLAGFGIESRAERRQELIGVWAGPAKIASIGVHVSRWITTHGFALNISTDLALFDGIVPCGLSDVRMTSIETLIGHRPEMADIAADLAGHFAEVFDRSLDRVSAEGLLAAADRPAERAEPVSL